MTALQEFRALVSPELLAPDLGIGVRTLTLLFTDLKDSTILYEQRGDNPAYAQVQDHFVALTRVVGANGGALVKTIGDALMVAFYDARDALRAAFAMHAAIATLNAAYPRRPPLVLKVGLHSGPCIAITANNVIDYFGSTVNVASRVQGLSLGDDILLTESARAEPGVAELLTGHTVETFTATLRGLTPEFTLHRLVARLPSTT